ncbi:DUF445 family protein [Streptomyces sp. NPDC005568]|uniref:DUF445 family protein n=1 Tax=Streptomyces sp. NPDC005568 TaxID=3156887 RepID=UPI0033AAFC52
MNTFSPADEEKRRGVRRMKITATGLLLFVALVYVLAKWASHQGAGAWAEYVAAAAEAGMVGALADWFAVTALFRHPLGLPIPHTAIIPNKKDQLGVSLGEFVGENFLSEEVVRQRLRAVGIGSRLGAWLAEPEHADRVTAELATALRGALTVLRDSDVQAVVGEAITRRADAQEIAPGIGKMLERVVADGGHHRVVDLVCVRAHDWLVLHGDSVMDAVQGGAPGWTPRFVDRKVGERVYKELLRFVTEMRDAPSHPARGALDRFLTDFASDLQSDTDTRARVERLKGEVLGRGTGATLVTAAGKQLTVSASEHKDLFWALRGAGNGNFGVVTELRFRTRPAPQCVTAYMSWPWSRAAAALKAWQEWGPDQPDEIWSSCHLASAPGGTPTVSVSAFSLGTYGELQNAVDRLADRIGAPARSVSLKRRSYEESMEVYAGCSAFAEDAQCHLPGSTPGRSPRGALGRETYAARSDFFDRSIPAAGVQTLLTQMAGVRGGSGSIALTALGGAVNRVSPTATAFVHRRSRMLAQYIASWRAGTSGTAAQGWLDTAHHAMSRHASGAAYQNYTDPTLTDWRKAYYGDAAPRLTALKKQYDPDRFFTFPQAL